MPDNEQTEVTDFKGKPVKCPQCSKPLERERIDPYDTHDGTGVVYACKECQTSFERDEL